MFKASASVEILIGVALLAAPSLVIELLLGDGLSSSGLAVARVLGVGLLSVGVAAWEVPQQEVRLAPRAGICIYTVGAALVFAVVGSLNETSGILLWPAVVLHGLIGVTMLRVIVSSP